MAEYMLYKQGGDNSRRKESEAGLYMFGVGEEENKKESNRVVNELAKKGTTFIGTRKRPTKKKRKSPKKG
ncbi:hypothetical protein [uncultured Clostridium sp.]|uniref:hypothetical protein n=1 Tax=uncultured Clostridium sp. TaxID=59620 RepID=UPI00263B84C4|nr:hypothetical protein [uncultured Clostridium sp.]